VTGLRELLSQARDRGYLGDQPIQRHIDHASGFSLVVSALMSGKAVAGDQAIQDGSEAPDGSLIDLGAGAGIPGLVLALAPPVGIHRIVLLEGSERRAEWLESSIELLRLAQSVEVLGLRAELAGRTPSWRHSAVVAVARSFGRPGVVAECAAPLLRLGGYLVVSEPPFRGENVVPEAPEVGARELSSSDGVEARWPPAHVAALGFSPAREWRAGGFRYAVLRVDTACPDRYPRRDGIPAKRPLF